MGIRTVSIPIQLDQNETERMDKLQTAAATIYNTYSQYCYGNDITSKAKAHEHCYHDLRETTKVPSSLVQAIGYSAVSNYKTARRDNLKQAPTCGDKLRTIPYNIRVCDLRGQQLTFSCFGKRIKKIITIPEWFNQRYPDKEFRTISITCKGNGEFFVNLCYKIPDNPPQTGGKALGIDRGMRHLAVTSDGKFFSSNELRASQRKHLHNRKTLQTKGTRSAKRKAREQSGKEKRFNQQVNHDVSKQIVEHAIEEGYNTIVLEDLTGIRNKRRGKVLNKRLASWPFYQLELFIKYKAENAGIRVVSVDPRYTSQRCFGCGKIDKKNRNKSHYLCGCGYRDHADVNAAKNIAALHLSSNTFWRPDEQAVINRPHEQASV